MQLNHETVTFSNGSEIIVSEADFAAAMRLNQLRDEAEKNPVEDALLQSFRVGLYPTLAASLDGKPTTEEAFQMLEADPDGINAWYRAVRRLNPDWFDYKEFDEKVEKIKFRDGLVLTVLDCRLPSVWYRIAKYRHAAQKSEDTRFNSFAWAFYPYLAGCCAPADDVPTCEEAYHFPNTELNKWYAVVDRLNPQLFKALKEVKQDAETLKKKDKSG